MGFFDRFRKSNDEVPQPTQTSTEPVATVDYAQRHEEMVQREMKNMERRGQVNRLREKYLNIKELINDNTIRLSPESLNAEIDQWLSNCESYLSTPDTPIPELPIGPQNILYSKKNAEFASIFLDAATGLPDFNVHVPIRHIEEGEELMSAADMIRMDQDFSMGAPTNTNSQLSSQPNTTSQWPNQQDVAQVSDDLSRRLEEAKKVQAEMEALMKNFQDSDGIKQR